MYWDSFCERCRVVTGTDKYKRCKKCGFPK